MDQHHTDLGYYPITSPDSLQACIKFIVNHRKSQTFLTKNASENLVIQEGWSGVFEDPEGTVFSGNLNQRAQENIKIQINHRQSKSELPAAQKRGPRPCTTQHTMSRWAKLFKHKVIWFLMQSDTCNLSCQRLGCSLASCGRTDDSLLCLNF